MPGRTKSLTVPAIVLWASSVIQPAAVAEEFSWQVTGRYEDVDAAVAAESSRSSLRATYYLSAVDDQSGPYELAPFLSRSSYVAVGTARTKLREQLYSAFTDAAFLSSGVLIGDVDPVLIGDVDPVGRFGGVGPVIGGFPAESGVDSTEYSLDGRYVWPGTGWYAGAHARRGDADVLPELLIAQSTLEQESTGLVAGRYFGPRTTLELALGSDTMSQELRVVPFVGIGPEFDLPVLPGLPGLPGFELQTRTATETENARLSVRHVGQLGSSTIALSASVRSSRSETNLFLPAPTVTFPGVNPLDPPDGLLIAGNPDLTSVEIFQSERERQIRLSGALFPTQALGVRLTFSNSDHDTFGSSDTVGLSANWFFVRNAAVEIELVRTGSGSRYFPGSPDMDSLGVRLLGRF